ncbi:hypothetical protein VQ574_21685 (plasmid) [Stutzerimonas frequens]|uniref:hypothetical protein n=1 Tax=Stutzerimonas frequens TaxID=2968969 RepID=UPI002DB85126|nr:hypothetical protein [Stutzerimonas frequens]WRW29340.1 hypothetical protein VQ574_21685 [Stutzerimonas frequens]
MAKKLPPIQSLSACPHCGCAEFYVEQTYSGKGPYHRTFAGGLGDNGEMYDCINHKAGKRAFCSDCREPVASWDEDKDADAFA